MTTESPSPAPAKPHAPSRAARDSRALTEGATFAERRAARLALPPPAQRLVSLGPTEWVERDRRGGTTVHDCELLVDIDHTSRVYVRFTPDGAPVSLLNDDRRDEITPLPALPDGRRKFGRPVSGTPAANPDPPPRPVAHPNEMFGSPGAYQRA